MSDNKNELSTPATPSTASGSPPKSRDLSKELMPPELLVEKSGSVRLAAALQEVADTLGRGEDRYFMVGLVGYRIDDVPYVATGLTMALHHTPEIEITQDGFTCVAFFPPQLLRPSTVRRHGIIRKQFGGDTLELVRVQVCVRSKDIFSVGEVGRQLFYDPNVTQRWSTFRKEAAAWRAREQADQ
jgi:hypothetical protein